jgi:hypothetical protein
MSRPMPGYGDEQSWPAGTGDPNDPRSPGDWDDDVTADDVARYVVPDSDEFDEAAMWGGMDR